MLQGVPLPYILGHWDFFGRSFKVTPDVLIPRPETELLVELAFHSIQDQNQPVIVDVGTGSGAIAVSLAAELPGANIAALDCSLPALKIAQLNARLYAQNQIRFVQSDLLTPFRIRFDLICANLPYIPRERLNGLNVSRWEPRLALDGGESGLDVILKLLHQAQTRLSPGGSVLLEIESSLGENALKAACTVFPDAQTTCHKDLAGHDRIIEIHLS